MRSQPESGGRGSRLAPAEEGGVRLTGTHGAGTERLAGVQRREGTDQGPGAREAVSSARRQPELAQTHAPPRLSGARRLQAGARLGVRESGASPPACTGRYCWQRPRPGALVAREGPTISGVPKGRGPPSRAGDLGLQGEGKRGEGVGRRKQADWGAPCAGPGRGRGRAQRTGQVTRSAARPPSLQLQPRRGLRLGGKVFVGLVWRSHPPSGLLELARAGSVGAALA